MTLEKQSNSSDFATIVLEVHNKSQNIDFEVLQSMTDGKEIHTPELNMKTGNESGNNHEIKSTIIKPFKPTVLNVQIEKLENIPLAERCMESGLGLRWRCFTDRMGQLRLSSLTLNSSEISELQASPLYWESEANGLILEPGDSNATQGETQNCIKIKTTATNRTNTTFTNIKVVHRKQTRESVKIIFLDNS